MPHPSQQPWQTTLNPRLVQRLMRPITQPGVIGSELADQIQARADRWANRLPLLAVGQRHLPAEGTPGHLPIVYAQPQPPADSNAPAESAATTVAVPPAVAMGQPPLVIQAKFAPGAPVQPGAGLLSDPQASPTLLRVQPTALTRFNGVDAASLALADQPARAVGAAEFDRMPLFQGPHSEGRSPLPTPLPAPLPGAAIVSPQRQSPMGQPLPIVTAHPVSRPPGLPNPEMSRPSLPGESQNLKMPTELLASFPPLQRPWAPQTQALAKHSSAELARPPGASAAKTIDPKPDQPRPLPWVRSLAPTSDWGQMAPLAIVSPIQSSPAAALGMVNLPREEAQTPLGGSAAAQTLGPASASTGPSIVRDIGGILATSPATPAAQPPQTVVSQTPSLDVEALVDQVERKLARRMAIERERRGWRS